MINRNVGDHIKVNDVSAVVTFKDGRKHLNMTGNADLPTLNKILKWAKTKPVKKAEPKKKLPKNSKYAVVCQCWEESERGWGCRPDGFTLHVSQANRDKFVDDYYKTHNNLSYAPDEYTRVDGDPYLVIIDRDTYAELLKNNGSMWGKGNIGPGPASQQSLIDLQNENNRS